jgi:hypothetical protein
VSIRESRKSRAETPPIVSNSRRPRSRPIGAAMLHHHSFRVNATEFARRQFLHLAAGTAALPAISRGARAQTYPMKPLHWIIGFPAGGLADILTRMIGQRPGEALRLAHENKLAPIDPKEVMRAAKAEITETHVKAACEVAEARRRRGS